MIKTCDGKKKTTGQVWTALQNLSTKSTRKRTSALQRQQTSITSSPCSLFIPSRVKSRTLCDDSLGAARSREQLVRETFPMILPSGPKLHQTYIFQISELITYSDLG